MLPTDKGTQGNNRPSAMKKGSLEFQRDPLGGSPVQTAAHKMARLSEESVREGAVAEGVGAAAGPAGGSSSAGLPVSSVGGGLPVLPPFPVGPGVPAPGSPFPVVPDAAAVADGTAVEVPGGSLEVPAGNSLCNISSERDQRRGGRRKS